MKRRITAQYLDNVALHYLQRFASSSANLRQVLLRRVERAAQAAEADAGDALRETGARLVDELVARYLRSGLLDDRVYAAAKAQSLHRRGASLRAIRQALASRGVDADTVGSAMAALTEATGDADLAAAVALARRRRLGPFRLGERGGYRDKDLASLGRAGFSYDIARRVVDAESREAAEDLVSR